jgi:hypothetical protein
LDDETQSALEQITTRKEILQEKLPVATDEICR